MTPNQPPRDMDVEDTFNEFVEVIGGELISKIFANQAQRPNNADYFLHNREIIAELKCLEKDYSNDSEVGKKLIKLMERWKREGLLRPEHIRGRIFHTEDLAPECGREVVKIFKSPIQNAVKKANEQIKETKKYFEVPNSKGLLILVNDGNYSVAPNLMMPILGNLFKSSYTSIDSYIFFTLNMRAYARPIERQFLIWVHGSTRPSSNEVEPEFLSELRQKWFSFLGRKTGQKVSQILPENRDIIDHIKFIK